MFNGIVYFKLTPNGYVVDDFIKSNLLTFISNPIRVWGCGINTVRIENSFDFNPVRGQFCKRPHKLINWSKP